MILVETRPIRMSAVQWHRPGDGRDFGEESYVLGSERRYGIPTMAGMKRIHPGDWIVTGTAGDPQVMSEGEFHHGFRIIEEGSSS